MKKKLRAGQQGARAERRVTNMFLDRGWTVFFPIYGESCEVDRVVYHRTSRQLYRVQVKLGGHRKSKTTNQRRFMVLKTRGASQKGVHYEPDDFDLLCLVDRETMDVFIVEWPTICQSWSGKWGVPTVLQLGMLQERHAAENWDGWGVAARSDQDFGRRSDDNKG